MAKDDINKIGQIVYDDDFMKDVNRKYPAFTDSMRNVAVVASVLLRKEITPYDVCIVMVALKLDRDGHHHKKDNLFDAIAYLSQAFKICEDNNEEGYGK